jgi:hypothetical protein
MLTIWNPLIALPGCLRTTHYTPAAERDRRPAAARRQSVFVRKRSEPRVERHGLGAGVKHNAADEALTHRRCHRPQAAEVLPTDRRARLDLDPDQSTGCVLQNDVDLGAGLRAELEVLRAGARPSELLGQLHHHEVLQQRAQQPRQRRQSLDVGHVAHVAQQDRRQVRAEPRRAAGGADARDDLRVAAGHNALDKVPTPRTLGPAQRKVAREDRVDDVLAHAIDLTLRRRPERDDLHVAGQRLREPRQPQHVGRAREQEPAGLAGAVDEHNRAVGQCDQQASVWVSLQRGPAFEPLCG